MGDQEMMIDCKERFGNESWWSFNLGLQSNLQSASNPSQVVSQQDLSKSQAEFGFRLGKGSQSYDH